MKCVVIRLCLVFPVTGPKLMTHWSIAYGHKLSQQYHLVSVLLDITLNLMFLSNWSLATLMMLTVFHSELVHSCAFTLEDSI